MKLRAGYVNIVFDIIQFTIIILPFVSVGVMLDISLWEREHTLMLSEKWILRRIFGQKKEEVGGGWRKLQIVELSNLYQSLDIIRGIKLKTRRGEMYVARKGDKK